MTENRLFAESALLSEGWAENVLFEFDEEGSIRGVTLGVEAGDAPRAAGPVLPGMPNLHSHAFQRAMAGLAERAGPKNDSFWTWREVMYGFVDTLTPEHIKAIAAQLYIEMLKAGYTAVGEFHYLHHNPDGQSYEDVAEMSRQVMVAAQETGIGLTLLPVLYGFGGFGGQAAGGAQRRFENKPERFLRLVETLVQECRNSRQQRIGMAPHSLRAVTPETLTQAIEGLDQISPSAPIHMSIAEQLQEVEDCAEWCGQRPVAWLLDHADVNARWCLVHATHMIDEETRGLAKSRAVAGLCPTTEANHGDGVFPAVDFLDQGGRFGIGSDSNISITPFEELRWLEYGQRLFHRRRNLLVESAAAPSVGAALYKNAVAGGAQALGRPIGRLGLGARADLIVIDTDRPLFVGKSGDLALDTLVFAGNGNPVRDVMVGGQWVVQEGRHMAEDLIYQRYKLSIAELIK